MEYLPRYTPGQMRRHDMKPGITGLAQVHGRHRVGWDERFRLDVSYVDRWSLRLDVAIMRATIGVVFEGQGEVDPKEEDHLFMGSAVPEPMAGMLDLEPAEAEAAAAAQEPWTADAGSPLRLAIPGVTLATEGLAPSAPRQVAVAAPGPSDQPALDQSAGRSTWVTDGALPALEAHGELTRLDAGLGPGPADHAADATEARTNGHPSAGNGGARLRSRPERRRLDRRRREGPGITRS
jgi:hypothetical protein